MDATNTVAWIGAITGSIGTVTGISGLLWDYYKWKNQRPKLKVTVLPHMVVHQPGSPLHEQKCILVKVSNIGQRKTTITTLALQFYETETDRQEKKAAFEGLVPNPGPGFGRLPHILDAGEQWTGMLEYDEKLIKMAKTGFLYCSIFHTLSEEPTMERVLVRNSA